MVPRPSVAETLRRVLIGPALAMRLRYVPLLMIYFAYGLSSLTAIAESFWVRRELQHLSGADLAAISVWATVPWTLKMVVGQLVDGVALFGSRRRVYVFAGALLTGVSYALLASLAKLDAPAQTLTRGYLAAQVLLACGFVLQDVTADAMSTEVVPRTEADGSPRPAADVDRDLGMVQLLGRLALMVGLLVASFLRGELAAAFPAHVVFGVGLVVPVLSVLGAALVRVDTEEPGEVDPRILGFGALFAVFSVGMGMSDVPFAQEIVFGVSLAVVLSMLAVTVRGSDPSALRRIVLAAFVIFVFRATPSSGEPVSWWEMDVLGFDERFFGHLGKISALVAIAATWFGSRAVTERPIPVVLGGLTVIGFLLSLPIIGMAYGLHEWTAAHFGFGVRAIALVDTAAASPLVQLSMVPMLTLIAVNAPPGKRATWFALMASLMNLATTAGNLGTKYLNQIIVVDRATEPFGPHSYPKVGALMITATALSTVLPLLAIALVGRRLAPPQPADAAADGAAAGDGAPADAAERPS